MRKERDELAAQPSDGLSAADADAIARFAADIPAGIDHASPADQRRLYERLQIRGTVAPTSPADPDAIHLGRSHRYRIDWTASIPLLDGDNRFR